MKNLFKKVKKDYHMDAEILALGTKRKELILKVLGQLYRGKIGTLQFKDGNIFKMDYYKDYNQQEKRKFNPFGDFKGLKEELMKNLHNLSEKFSDEDLSILEFLMDKMDKEWWTFEMRDDVNIISIGNHDKEILKEIKDDIQAIKNRCVNYLMIMQIEESER